MGKRADHSVSEFANYPRDSRTYGVQRPQYYANWAFQQSLPPVG